MKVGLYFGSFNPIHNGHLIIANKMRMAANLDEVWFIPSPQNPFKEEKDLLDFSARLEMIQAVLNQHPHIKVHDIEENLPKPSYTIQTMRKLSDIYPEIDFHIIIGGDNLEHLHLWKNIDELLDRYSFHVYQRVDMDKTKSTEYSNVYLYDLPLIELSSTSIRKSIRDRIDILGEVDSVVRDLIVSNQWYL